MCHGAGGVSADQRFGARTAIAPLFMESVLCALAIALGPDVAALLATVPEAAFGALLGFASLSLAGTADLCRRLPDSSGAGPSGSPCCVWSRIRLSRSSQAGRVGCSPCVVSYEATRSDR